MILAAGRGERLRPLTDSIPKALVPAGGVPLIEHNIRRLKAAGVTEFVVNTAWLGSAIRSRLGSGETLGVHILYSDEGKTALETGGGIRKALPFLSDPFWVVNADVYSNYDFSAVLEDQATLAHLVLVPNPGHNPAGDFSVDGARLLPGHGGEFTFAGISLMRHALIEHIDPGAFPLAPLLRDAAAQRRVSAEIHDGAWFDVGTHERLAALERWLEETGEPRQD